MNPTTNNTPPSWMMRLLKWFCDPDLLEDVEGDLSELYNELCDNSRFPRLLLFWDILLLFRPGIIKDNFVTRFYFTQSMYSNYMKSAWRNLLKHKTFSFINVSSLSIGMAICMVIFLFAQQEFTFDDFHKKNIYRFWETEKYDGSDGQDIPFTMGGVGPNFTRNYPEILDYSRVLSVGDEVLVLEDGNILMDGIKSVDSNFFEFFDFKLIHGNTGNVFNSSTDIAVSETTALNMFGTVDALGKTVKYKNISHTVRAVFQDIPVNSHLQFNILFSLEGFKSRRPNYDNEFRGSFITTYVELDKYADLAKLEGSFPAFLDKTSGKNLSENYKIHLQPMADIHLESGFLEHDYYNFRKFDQFYVTAFIAIGLILLLIAIINFTNLTTARSSYRTKEVGVRKALGAIRSQVVVQFQLESLLLSFLALLVSILLVWVGLPFINQLVERDFTIYQLILDPIVLITMIGMTFLIGLIAGMYPSLQLSRFSLINIFKAINGKYSKSYLRSTLIVVQFSLAIGMIVSTLIVINQLSYIKNKDLGFNKNHILQIRLIDDNAMQFYDAMKQEMLRQSSVLGVTGSGHRIGNDFHQRGFKAKSDSGMSFYAPASLFVDEDYLELFEIDIVKGRNFSNEFSTDEGLAFVVNESMANELGGDVIGMKAGMGWYPNDSLGTIVGVTKDFNFNTLHTKIDNLVLHTTKEQGFQEMSVKLAHQNLNEAIKQVEEIYYKYSDVPIEYQFLDEHFDNIYKSDRQMQSVLTIIGGISIVLGCMGLFGLTSITVQKRLKEIGIRKVIGASNKQLLLLLSKDFGFSIVIAFLISAPASYLLVNTWLENFAFRINVNPLLFVAGGVISFLIAWMTISIQVGKAIRANPVKALKNE